MRFTGTIGAYVVAALAAMAFIGVGSASASTTALCKVHEEPCSEANQVKTLTLESATGTIVIALTSTADVLCLATEIKSNVLGITAPQLVHTSSLSITNCGTNSAHNNCTATVNELPLLELLRTGLNLGTLSLLSGAGEGIVGIKCTIIGFIKINCDYKGGGLSFSLEGVSHSTEAGNGMLTSTNTPLNSSESLEGGGLCPATSSLDWLLEPTEPVYIVGNTSPSGTALCKTHSGKVCAEKDQAKSVHLAAPEPPVFLNEVANVECEDSLASGTVLALGTAPTAQKIDISTWSWSGCHTQGATDNCTVTSKNSPLIELQRSALNLGEADMSSISLRIECNVLGLHEMDCTLGTTANFDAEGALASEGTGHGMFTANEVVLEETGGGKYCPDSAKWSALYEPLEHLYILE